MPRRRQAASRRPFQAPTRTPPHHCPGQDEAHSPDPRGEPGQRQPRALRHNFCMTIRCPTARVALVLVRELGRGGSDNPLSGDWCDTPARSSHHYAQSRVAASMRPGVQTRE